MAKIQFENGTIVEFDGEPTTQDVEFVAQQLGIKKDEKQGFFQEAKSRIKNVVEETKKNVIGIADTYAKNKNLAATALSSTAILPKLAGDVLVEGVKMATPDVVKSGIKEILNHPNIKELVTDPGVKKSVIEPLISLAKENPQTARAVKDLLDIVSALPATKAVQGIEKGVVSGVEGAGKLASKGVESVSKTAEPVGKGLEKLGETAYKLTIPMSKQEAAMVQAYRAENPLLKRIFGETTGEPLTAASTAARKELAGTESMIGVQAKRAADSLWSSKIGPAVKGIKENYNIPDAFKRIADKINLIPEAGRRQDLLDGLEAMVYAYRNEPRDVAAEVAQSIKSHLDKFTPEKAFNGKPIGSAYKDIQNMFANDVRSWTYDKLGDVNIKTDYLDWGNLKGLQEFGQTAMTGAKFKGGLGGWINAAKENLLVPAGTTTGLLLKKAGSALRSIKK